VARAQQRGKIARIGFLGAASASGYTSQVEGFRLGMRDLGYIEGTNIIIDYRWAEGRYERLPELAADLVRSKVDVIVTHGSPGSLVAKQTTATVPIVMAIIGDAVATGVVASLARPGGNITGSSFFSPELNAKRIELLKDVNPHLTRVAILFNPDNPSASREVQAAEAAGRSLNMGLQKIPVRGPHEFEAAFDRMEQERVEAVASGDDGLLLATARTIATLATRRRLLSIGNAEFAQAGGLIGYGVDFFAIFRRAAVFVDKILKGTNPADLAVEQPTKFELVINLKTAKALGLTVPDTLLARADEVIE
jgi:putative ABC transport system substrate-binding protein